MLLLCLFGLPPLHELERFPGEALAAEQVERCALHVARLRWYRYTGGYERYGHLDAAIAETQARQDYWQALLLVHTTPGRQWQRQALAEFRVLIGPYRYHTGWKPPLLPGSEAFADPEWPEPAMPRKNP